MPVGRHNCFLYHAASNVASNVVEHERPMSPKGAERLFMGYDQHDSNMGHGSDSGEFYQHDSERSSFSDAGRHG
jgi:hypothetical protein